MSCQKNTLETTNISQEVPLESSVGKAISQLKCAQVYYAKGDIKSALKWGHWALSQRKLGMNIRLRIIDLLGQCYHRSHSPKEVYLCLQKSIKYLNRFPSEPFAFSIYSHYLDALIDLDFKQEALEEFEHYPIYIKRIKDDASWLKRYLIIKKLQYKFAKKYATPEDVWPIIEAINEIAQFIDDQSMIEFAEKELKLYHFEETQVNLFEGWIYLQQDRLALFTKGKRVAKLYKNKAIKNILDLLILGPKTTKEFFKIVTKTTYNHELHEKYLYHILSKVRQVLSDRSVIVKEGEIALM